jgi:hypothetical protein
MMMEDFEYPSLLKQLNEEQRLIFDDVMHRNQLYINTFICLFSTWGKIFTLKLIIQGLLQSYNRDIYSDLIKTKALLMTSTLKLLSILMV